MKLDIGRNNQFINKSIKQYLDSSYLDGKNAENNDKTHKQSGQLHYCNITATMFRFS